MLQDNRKVVLVIAILAIAGIVTMLNATRFGIGVGPDSTVYIDAARNLAHANGLIVLSGTSTALKPLTHYPPMYPSLLALLGSSGAEIPNVARWLNAFLFAANIFLVGLTIRRYAPDSFWLPVLSAFLMLTASDVLGISSFAYTEPLFIFLVMIGLLCLANYVEKNQRHFLMAGAAAMGLSILARYVGVVSIITGAVVLLFLNSKSLRRRLLDALTFGCLACAPIGIWSIRNHFAGGGATDRQFVFHPPSLHQLISGFSTVASWLLIGRVRFDIRITGFVIEMILGAVLLIYLLKNARPGFHNEEESLVRLPHILAIFVSAYVAFLIFTASFVDADTVFDHRSLLPVHVAALVLVPCLLRRLYLRSAQSRLARAIFIALALTLAGSYTFRSVRWFMQTRDDGQWYASKTWRDSRTIAALGNLPSDATIYSNGADAIYYLTGRRAIFIPEEIIHATGRPNVNYEIELQNLKADMRINNAVLVYFTTLPERGSLPSENELKEQLNARAIVTEPDGILFSLR